MQSNHHTMNTPEQIKQAEPHYSGHYYYQRLFDAINEAGQNPTQGQMDDIIYVVQKYHSEAPKPVQNDAFVEWLEAHIEACHINSMNLLETRLTQVLAKYKELSESGGDGWVRVSDAKPKYSGNYLIFVQNTDGRSYTDLSQFDSEAGMWIDNEWNIYFKVENASWKPTHWRELPQPPINK